MWYNKNRIGKISQSKSKQKSDFHTHNDIFKGLNASNVFNAMLAI